MKSLFQFHLHQRFFNVQKMILLIAAERQSRNSYHFFSIFIPREKSRFSCNESISQKLRWNDCEFICQMINCLGNLSPHGKRNRFVWHKIILLSNFFRSFGPLSGKLRPRRHIEDPISSMTSQMIAIRSSYEIMGGFCLVFNSSFWWHIHWLCKPRVPIYNIEGPLQWCDNDVREFLSNFARYVIEILWECCILEFFLNSHFHILSPLCMYVIGCQYCVVQTNGMHSSSHLHFCRIFSGLCNSHEGIYMTIFLCLQRRKESLKYTFLRTISRVFRRTFFWLDKTIKHWHIFPFQSSPNLYTFMKIFIHSLVIRHRHRCSFFSRSYPSLDWLEKWMRAHDGGAKGVWELPWGWWWGEKREFCDVQHMSGII